MWSNRAVANSMSILNRYLQCPTQTMEVSLGNILNQAALDIFNILEKLY